jgi:hypothetical protein
MSAAFDRARRLLQSPALNWVREAIPADMRDSPAHLKHLLAYAATIDAQVRDSAGLGRISAFEPELRVGGAWPVAVGDRLMFEIGCASNGTTAAVNIAPDPRAG